MTENKSKSYIGLKAGLIVIFGVVFGMLLENIAVGIALGVVFSVAIGSNNKRDE